MRIPHANVIGALLLLVAGGCMGGTGSGLVGICCGDDGNGNTGGGALVLSYFAQPNTARAGQVMSAVQVVARDSLGSVVATFEGGVNVALASNSTGAGLSGTRTARATDGVATFRNLSIDRPGTYTLRASASGAAAVTSDPFTVTAATP
jgi:hypothetical protein